VDDKTKDPIAPGQGRYEVWGESGNHLNRYWATGAEAREHIERLKQADQDNNRSSLTSQEYRISPNAGNGRCPGCGDPRPRESPPKQHL
jgi:hypothetical protein